MRVCDRAKGERERRQSKSVRVMSVCYSQSHSLSPRQICEQRSLYPEMVFILGRMGNTKQALALIIDKIGDVKEAREARERERERERWREREMREMGLDKKTNQ